MAASGTQSSTCAGEAGGLTGGNDQEMSRLLTSATTGNSQAMSELGVIFANGKCGQAVNLEQAYIWFERAAEQGHISSCVNCGKLLLKGCLPSNADPQKAFRLLTGAAKIGIGDALKLAGDCLQQGVGCLVNEQKAFTCYKVGAEHGDAACMASLGHALIHGKGCDADSEQAFAWMERAAEWGDANGLRNAGLMLCMGQGCVKDEERGKELLQQAADAGDVEAAEQVAMMVAWLD